MKKITILAFLCALFVGASANAQEVTYKEDASQGYLMNKFKDNWFLSLEAGANLWSTPNDLEESFLKRIQPQVELQVGKWFSPIIGLRVGVSGARVKGATLLGYSNNTGVVKDEIACGNDKYYHQVQFQWGLSGDVMLNLSNWWGGYKADRIYNAIFYAGTTITGLGSNDGSFGFDIQDQEFLGVRVGLLNNFAISKKVDLLVDLRFGANQTGLEGRLFTYKTDLLIGASYKFGKSTWNAPTVPVCPTFKYTDAEGDALVARLQQADAKIASLEQQLRDCLNSKQTAVVEEAPAAPLATIYFPIGSATVNSVQAKVVNAVANAMQNTDEKYVLTGWADNYTGTAEINKKLRAKRADSVKKMIVKKGVAADRLEATTNDNNLTEYGEKSASLDRAVTITVAE